MRRRVWRMTIGCVTLAALAVTTGLAAADILPGNVGYDGKFVFVRLRYEMSRGGVRGLFGGDLPWAHDYPRAERNLSRILEAVTLINPFEGPNGGNVLSLDDPELYKFPFAYMSEPGYWEMSAAEVEGLRSYLLKGGFVVFDDFRGDHWDNFTGQLQRVLPDARLMPLDISHPVFHSFFDIETLAMPPVYGRAPTFWGIFEDNDPTRRLMVVANYDNDIGEYWEYSDTGWYPIDLSNEAYKFGVNYSIYSLTH
jgi:hypothetical protein